MNHVMTDLRAERRAATRDGIVRATLELLIDHDPAAVSMPAVAEASGVSLRTLYRYFPTKTDLFDAAGGWFDGRTWAEAVGRADIDELAPDDFLPYQRARFADFASNRPGVLAQLTTATGRRLRQARLAEQRPPVRALLESLDLGLDPADGERLTDAVLAISSSAMFVELVERMGHEPTDAADLTVWMAQALLAHAEATATTRPSTLAPTSPEEATP